jgi:type I restriction enzyme S subunit
VNKSARIKNIPESWEVAPLKYACQIINGYAFDSNTYMEEGIPIIRISDISQSIEWQFVKRVPQDYLNRLSRFKILKGDILVALTGATIGKSCVYKENIIALLNQRVAAIRTTFIEQSFLSYFIQSTLFTKSIDYLCYGGAQENISKDDIGQILCPIPLREKQKEIASFLDRKTAAIDALIAKKQRLIKLLEEKRSALINQAVTKGLNPNAPMKDSGLPWIGEIPEHWEMIAIKRLARPGRKTFVDGDWIELPYITEEGVRLIQTGNVAIGQYREKGFRYVSEETLKKLKCTEVEPNNVLICRLDGPVGRACLAPDLGIQMITSVDNVILKPDPKHDPRFIVYFMSSKPYLEWNQVLCRVGGGHRWRISRSMLGDLKIPAPPTEEQCRIADYLEQQTIKIRSTVELLLKQIEKLQEYRQSLITATVTGKMDITQEEAA